MVQLHCHVPEEIASQARNRAEQTGLGLSRYLAALIERDALESSHWPEGYFDLFGGWQGEPLERAPQGEFEKRLLLK